MAAIGPVEVLQNQTVLNKPVKYGDVYWYMTPGNSFGFSSSNKINQKSANIDRTSPELRLSWHLDQSDGGYRAGATVDLNTNTVLIINLKLVKNLSAFNNSPKKITAIPILIEYHLFILHYKLVKT